ncbi:MAG: DUF6232 family protein [Actinoplanes sp.]
MRIYYQGPEAVVTSDFFIRRGSVPNTFAIRDLRGVCIAPETADGFGPVGYTAAASLAAAVVVLGLAGPWFAAGFLGLATASVGCVAVRWRQRPRRQELRADYRGETVTLYASCDERVFNQVSRALRRALENLPPPSTWNAPAAA